MPELVEVETYRREAERMLHRKVSSVVADDGWFLKEATSPEALTDCLVGETFSTARRIGKLLLLDVHDSEHVLGLRFGMTGRLVVDGGAVIQELLYSSHRQDPKFVRFAINFVDGGRAEISDPRRLGGVALDPSVKDLGPDAADLSLAQLRAALHGSQSPLKARLMDQSRIAGVGNLIADETLWKAKLSPVQLAGTLSAAQSKRLHHTLVDTIAELQERGGSHMGDLMSSRNRDGVCPRCGTALSREQVGGRTSYWCPAEQVQ